MAVVKEAEIVPVQRAAIAARPVVASQFLRLWPKCGLQKPTDCRASSTTMVECRRSRWRRQGVLVTHMPHDVAARLGHETIRILEAKSYRAPSGRTIDLASVFDAALEGTVEYPPERDVAQPASQRPQHRITVENETVLTVGRLMSATSPVAALNFASATTPGGGFLTGARAQEESIARSSGLVHCLYGRQMYARHREDLDAMYSDYVIYSPAVPVFRDDAGDLLEEAWPLSILTSPAVYGYGLEHYEPHRLGEIPAVMRGRAKKVLAVAAAHGHRRLILGAWGCGAFGLDPAMMARIFAETLEVFGGAFDEIVFAITDWSREQRFIQPFRDVFGAS
jgi:uncharacterized protein (TIGR02452 family)